ncbi:DMT family transporter [Bacillus sp. BRMEA1]|uniref:DMT family transporter n=1 Tax=Neobacillus endophyticus TaxID=2738405 RepID=UPI0015666D2B|nr:DMT family transporter [Neobacillus endophyticus]NRD80391.1 DMT family transporter [Neobacillus endophyticus]
MWVAAAIVTMLSFGTNNTIFKWSSGKGLSKLHLQFFFYITAFLLTLCYGFFSGGFHLGIYGIFLGSLIGILNANGNIQMAKAFEAGPASLTSPLVGTNAIFPILSAGIIFQEHIAVLQWVGIVFMLGSAVVIQYSPGSGHFVNYRPWISRIIFSIMSFGLLGILMKTTAFLHIHSLEILISMYGGGAVYLAVFSLINKEKWQKSEGNVGALVGVLSIIGYSSYFYALQSGTASIVFPIVSLNCLVVILAGFILFHEKLKSYQMIGVLTALLGIILTKI